MARPKRSRGMTPPLTSLRRLTSELEQAVHERSHQVVHAVQLLVLRLDEAVLVRSVSAIAPAEPEMPGGELERLAGEHGARPGPPASGNQHRIDAVALVHAPLRLDQLRARRRRRGVVPAAVDHDLEAAVTPLRQVDGKTK